MPYSPFGLASRNLRMILQFFAYHFAQSLFQHALLCLNMLT